MKKIFMFFILIFLLGCGENSNNTTQYNRQIIIPLYNINKWNKVATYKKEIVILNPNNGPGNSVNANYQELITKLNHNNDLPIGYIYTKYGNRNIDEVEQDIDKWISYYKIKGFFIDEVSINKSKLDYYTKLSAYIKSKGNYFIVLNPGTMPYNGYFDIADNVVVFENNVKKLNSNICKTQKEKSSIMVYDANETQMKNIIRTYKCKNIYVTDNNLSNLYDTLPSYFDEEIKLLK